MFRYPTVYVMKMTKKVGILVGDTFPEIDKEVIKNKIKVAIENNTNDYKEIEDEVRHARNDKEKNRVIKKWLQPILDEEHKCNTTKKLLIFYKEGI